MKQRKKQGKRRWGGKRERHQHRKRKGGVVGRQECVFLLPLLLVPQTPPQGQNCLNSGQCRWYQPVDTEKGGLRADTDTASYSSASEHTPTYKHLHTQTPVAPEEYREQYRGVPQPGERCNSTHCWDLRSQHGLWKKCILKSKRSELSLAHRNKKRITWHLQLRGKLNVAWSLCAFYISFRWLTAFIVVVI